MAASGMGALKHGTQPRSNDRYWAPKLRRNRERDQRVNDALGFADWVALRIWEHVPPDEAVALVAAALAATER